MPADHIRDTGTGNFGKLFFNILYRSNIGKRLMRPVEVILYKPFTQPRIELFRVSGQIEVVKPFTILRSH